MAAAKSRTSFWALLLGGLLAAVWVSVQFPRESWSGPGAVVVLLVFVGLAFYGRASGQKAPE